VRAARLTEALRRVPTVASETTPPLPAGANLTQSDLIYLRTGAGTTRFVALAELVVVQAEENYSAIHLSDGTRLFVRRTMKSWDDSLPLSHFVRVHRSTIVNLAHYRGSDRESFETMLLHFAGHARPVRVRWALSREGFFQPSERPRSGRRRPPRWPKGSSRWPPRW